MHPQLYEHLGDPDWVNVCQCLQFLNDSKRVAGVLMNLISGTEVGAFAFADSCERIADRIAPLCVCRSHAGTSHGSTASSLPAGGEREPTIPDRRVRCSAAALAPTGNTETC